MKEKRGRGRGGGGEEKGSCTENARLVFVSPDHPNAFAMREDLREKKGGRGREGGKKENAR